VVSFEYRWGEGPSFSVDLECSFDISEYKPAQFARPAAGDRVDPALRRGGSQGFTLPRDLPSAVIRLDGAPGAPPTFTLTGPHGLRVAYTATTGEPLSGPGYELLVVPDRGQTILRLAKPPAGGYSLAEGGGAALAAASVARGLPEPSVRANLERVGKGRYKLAYRVRPIRGQRVTFVEEAEGVTNRLGAAHGARGRLAFHPAVASERKRRVFAVVEQDGTPRARIAVARFKAPANAGPGKPRGVRLHRRGGRLLVKWRPASDAVRYAVGWALRDGRHQSEVTRAHRFVLTDVPGIDAGKIKVAGLRRDGVAGQPVVARLKPKPKRHKHGRGR
jgi:hypothetical protein